MKIIKSGVGAWRLTLTHKDCGSELEIEETDVEFAELSSGYCETEWCYIVRCGACGEIIELNLNKLPDWVRRRAEGRAKR